MIVNFKRLTICVFAALAASGLLNTWLAYQQALPLWPGAWLLAFLCGAVFQGLVTIRLPVFSSYYQGQSSAGIAGGKAAMVLASLLAGCMAALAWYLCGATEAAIVRAAFNAAVSAGIVGTYWKF